MAEIFNIFKDGYRFLAKLLVWKKHLFEAEVLYDTGRPNPMTYFGGDDSLAVRCLT